MNEKLTRRNLLEITLKAGISSLFVPKLKVWSIINSLDVNEKQIIERVIPSTGEKIPAIGMGTWQTFDVGESQDKRAGVEEVLKLFVEMGGKFIDSSPMYGSSEEVVGDLANKLGLLDSLFIATKVWTSGEQQGINQMEESMNLLKSPKLDLMQVHNLLDYRAHLQTLKNWKEEGKIRYIGITHYTTSSYDDLMRVMKEYPLDFVQFNYSIKTREAENSILPFAAENGIAVVINRPFEGGSIFSRVKGKEVPSWAAEFDCNSWGNFFLKYIISNPAVTCAIPATDNINHMKDNMNALYGKLPDQKMRMKMVNYFENL